MKNILVLFFCLSLVACNKQSDYSLTIVHTSDLHSHILPFNEYDDCNLDSTECLGGMARIITFMQNEKSQTTNLLTIDSGDRFTGTAYYSLARSKYLLPLFKMMPYDVATLGNHEFDNNFDDTENFISQWQVPIVATNLEISPKEAVYPLIKKSMIIKKGNRKIGILGALTSEIVIFGDYDVHLLPIKEAFEGEIQKLKEQNIDIIIVISHLGYKYDLQLAQDFPDIDIIVGGHSHSLLNNDKQNPLSVGKYPTVVGSTLIVASGFGGQYIGKLQTKFDDNGKIIEYEGDTIAVSGKIANNVDAVKSIKQAQIDLKNILQKPVAILSQSYGFTENTNYCSEDCYIGEFLGYLLSKEFPDIDGVIYNAGSIRSALNAGDVLYENILAVYPYNSAVVIIELSGKELEEYLNHGLKNYETNAKTNELLQTYNIKYEFDSKDKIAKNITVKGQKLDAHKIYKLLTSAYVANGGDGYPVKQLTKSGHNVIGILLEQLKNPANLNYKMQHNVRRIF